MPAEAPAVIPSQEAPPASCVGQPASSWVSRRSDLSDEASARVARPSPPRTA